MAQVTRVLFTWIIAASIGYPAFAEMDIPPDLPDPKAVNAFNQYWGAFEKYEDKVLNEGRIEYQKAWQEVRRSFVKKQKELSLIQLTALQKSAAKYRKHLADHPRANNAPYVLLNLAQILNLIGDHLAKTDKNSSVFSKNEALGFLVDLQARYPGFDQIESAMYLRANILESQKRKKDAYRVWQNLASKAENSIYGVHANIAVGDRKFEEEDNRGAFLAYSRAKTLLDDIDVEKKEYEIVRVNYRLAWGAYRTGEMKISIRAATALLVPGRKIKTADKRIKMQKDAIDLIGDALYELNDLSYTKSVLARKGLLEFSPAIGLRVASRYGANGIEEEASLIGSFLVDEYPLSGSLPYILELTAESFKNLGNPKQQVVMLEKIALLLPSESLWRSRHKENFDLIEEMEKKAIRAARIVAGFRYEQGLASGSVKSFLAAAANYDILIDNDENGENSNERRLKRANCYFFANQLDDAAKMYIDLKSKYKVSESILQIAGYQLVLTQEKRWRKSYGFVSARDKNPLTEKDTLARLAELEQAIDEFANRFPHQNRSVDLLLVGGSANRDMERYETAAKFWQRALVSTPKDSQRATAIRGLVYVSMRDGSNGDVVEVASRFLRLENWKELGLTLDNELKGVLSAAALDEGNRLNRSGKVHTAGEMLVGIAEEFKDIPNRDKIYRDGAYLLAISGDWTNAQKAAKNYLKEPKLRRYRSDITYLLARTHEYKIDLHEAAKTYVDLGRKYPNHSRSRASLMRAEGLALGENDYALAAEATALLAEREKRGDTRLEAYGRAVNYMESANKPEKAYALAERRLHKSNTKAEKFTSKILMAKALYQKGNEVEALDELELINKKLDRNRNSLGGDYSRLSAKTNILLAEESKRKFDDFRIAERSGGVANNIRHKDKYLEELVRKYDKVAATNHPELGPKAKFMAGSALESYAVEIATAIADEPLPFKTRKRLEVKVERLSDKAKSYYSTNAARSIRASESDNVWVKKSAVRMSGFGEEKYRAKYKEELPTAVHLELPNQWSL